MWVGPFLTPNKNTLLVCVFLCACKQNILPFYFWRLLRNNREGMSTTARYPRSSWSSQAGRPRAHTPPPPSKIRVGIVRVYFQKYWNHPFFLLVQVLKVSFILSSVTHFGIDYCNSLSLCVLFLAPKTFAHRMVRWSNSICIPGSSSGSSGSPSKPPA